MKTNKPNKIAIQIAARAPHMRYAKASHWLEDGIISFLLGHATVHTTMQHGILISQQNRNQKFSPPLKMKKRGECPRNGKVKKTLL